MQDRENNSLIVTCPGCGSKNRIRAHASTTQPRCGVCRRSLADLSPWSATTHKPSSKSYGNLYGMLTIGLVVGVLILLAVVTGGKKRCGRFQSIEARRSSNQQTCRASLEPTAQQRNHDQISCP